MALHRMPRTVGPSIAPALLWSAACLPIFLSPRPRISMSQIQYQASVFSSSIDSFLTRHRIGVWRGVGAVVLIALLVGNSRWDDSRFSSLLAIVGVLGVVAATIGRLWCVGIGYSMTQTPSGRLLRRSTTSADRPAVFAAQFSLSHACWLITYPLAGQIGARFGMTAAFATLAAISALGVLAAWRFWPANDPDIIEHHHAEGDTTHLAEGDRTGETSHRHAFTIDDDHPRWPDSR